MFSWIHIEDVFQIILFLMEHKEISGVLNCSAPNPVTNQTLMKTLRQIMNVKMGLPSPAWLLQMGAVLIRTETELILKSRWVLPERIVQAGYRFRYPELKFALEEAIR